MSLKKIGLVALIIFLAVFMIQSPVEAATLVETIANTGANVFTSAAQSLTTFVQTLF